MKIECNEINQDLYLEMKQKTNGFGIASLVLGILGFLSPLLSILAIIFGAIGLHKKQKYSKAGLILGIIWLSLQALAVIFFFSFLAAIF